ncbi:MAG: DAK2 domain-containing protein [Clostridia bacterium]|nr:DAK2 domain-containing protein [Clostridia bacterium]
MATRTLDGKSYAQMLMGGAAVLSKHIEELNALNVFPVQDGDTGTNMSRTIEGGLAQAAEATDDLGEFSRRFSKGVLLSARGNSGVILSQIFAGIDESLEGLACADAKALAEAYKNGILKSYAAVQNPTEGTILTVFRESAEYAAGRVAEDSPVEEFYQNLLTEAKRSLAETTQLLPVLREADVVDSGAAGYLYITQGMYEALTGSIQPDYSLETRPQLQQAVNIELFTRDSRLEFGYCTEFLLRLTTDRVDPDAFEIQTVLNDLTALGGESVVAYKTDDIVKVHVHTFTPGRILSKMQDYGEFLTVKIENMQLGHTEQPDGEAKAEKKPFCVVAVYSGEAMGQRFRDLGADELICGGQTSNPSAQDFIRAFARCNSDNILVLPNNKNIVMAAKQAAELYENADVHVIETENFLQGLSALAVITPGISDMDTLTVSALHAAKGVKCCEITRAVRDAVVGGVSIREGQYMALGEGGLCALGDTPEDAAKEMIRRQDMELSEIVTLFTGKQADGERAEALRQELEKLCPDCEVNLLSGGQDVYDYLIGIE